MNEKKRRDITLGEMQDECKKRNAYCGDMGICPYRDFCHETVGDKCGWGDKGPREWKLSDPPRFNEAQMAFWRGWYAMGARWVRRRTGTACVDFSTTTEGFCTSWSSVIPNEIAIKLEEGISLDLAELLGKDSQ